MNRRNAKLSALVTACLAFSSCIEVKDFGAYWNKGLIDPAMQGTWSKVGLAGEDSNAVPGPDELRFMKDRSSYLLQAYTKGNKEGNKTRYAVKSLKIGNHMFVMVKGPKTKNGWIEQYTIKDNKLQEYVLVNGAAIDYLRTKHSTARNIVGDDGSVVVKTFDDEVFQILSEMAHDPKFWELQCEYQKI